MPNGKKQHKNPVRKVDTHKVTSGAAGKRKAANDRIKRAEKARLAATQAILAKKEAAVAVTPLAAKPKRMNVDKTQQNRKVAQSSSRLVAASPAIHAVAAATIQRQTQLA